MTMSDDRTDREHKKFVETANGNTAVRTSGDTWDGFFNALPVTDGRMVFSVEDNGISAGLIPQTTIPLNYGFLNSAGYWTRFLTDIDDGTIAAGQTPQLVNGLMYYYEAKSGNWQRWEGEDGAMWMTLFGLYDTTGNSICNETVHAIKAIGTITPTDNLATTTTGLSTVPFNMVYDGSTWDFQRGTATDGTLVNLGANNGVTITDGTNDVYVWGSGAITTAKAVHRRIMLSKEFYCTYRWADVADDASIYLHIKVDSTNSAHGYFIVEAGGKCFVDLYENPTTTGDGTGLTELSMNRETIGTPVTTLFRDPTVSADGTILEYGLLGTAGKFTMAGGDVSGAYWMLKPNEQYVLKITNKSGAAIDILAQYNWHEHLAV